MSRLSFASRSLSPNILTRELSEVLRTVTAAGGGSGGASVLTVVSGLVCQGCVAMSAAAPAARTMPSAIIAIVRAVRRVRTAGAGVAATAASEAPTSPSTALIRRSMCVRKSRPLSTGAALKNENAFRLSGSSASAGMLAPSISTGMTGTPRSIAPSSSTRTGSAASAIRLAPSSRRPSHCGPTIAIRASHCCRACPMCRRKSVPNGMASMSMNTAASP